MSSLAKALTLITLVLLAGLGLVVWKAKFGSHDEEGLTKLTKQDMEFILKDAPPQLLKQLQDNPELKKKQAEGIKGLLAIAAEARRTGFADKPEIQEALEDIKNKTYAQYYDEEKNKGKELPPFSSITKEQTDAYMQNAENAAQFDAWIKTRIDEAKKMKRLPENFEVPAEQLEQAKEEYAKIKIASEEAKKNWSSLPEEIRHEAELQAKLQQTQYLAQKYAADELAPKLTPTDEEVDQYLAAHPEEAKVLTEKKAKADEILKRAKAGEDFAKLAQENTEDPGSKKDGGLYKDVALGQMNPEFEKAALALQPGQIAEAPVETKYGYHIIKLERKGAGKTPDGKEGETYDVRHILISTASADPENPFAQPVSVKDKIKADLGNEKEKKLVEEMIAKNHIEVAEDYEIKVPEMPQGQEEMPGQPQIDPKQMEEIQKRLKEMQENKGKEQKPAAPGAKPKAPKE